MNFLSPLVEKVHFPLFSGIAALYYPYRRIRHWHSDRSLYFQRIPKSRIMRPVSREDGGPRKSSVAMEQPATTNSTPTKRTPTPTAEMMAVPLLQALLYRQRDELGTERAAVKALQRTRAAEIKAVREEEAVKCRNLLSDLKSRYGSYCTPPFACFLGCFSGAVSTV